MIKLKLANITGPPFQKDEVAVCQSKETACLVLKKVFVKYKYFVKKSGCVAGKRRKF